MKILLTLFILLFSSSLVADDISDFQIEGISVGDNLLDYFSEYEIKNNIRKEAYTYKKDKKFLTAQFEKFSFFNTYDFVVVSYKIIDKNNYEIGSVSGGILYNNNMSKCILKQDEIISDFSSILIGFDKNEKYSANHPSDDSGKSKYTSIWHSFKGGEIAIHCLDWSEEIGWQDNLRVAINSNEFEKWIE